MNFSTIAQAYPPLLGGIAAWALLGLRLIWSAELLVYGLPMLKHPLHWMDRPDSSATFPPPIQALGAFTIVGGGIAILIGLLTPLAAFGLAGAMVIALVLHLKNGMPFAKPRPDAAGESYDTSLLYLAIAILLMVLGPGTLSLDAVLFANNSLIANLLQP